MPALGKTHDLHTTTCLHLFRQNHYQRILLKPKLVIDPHHKPPIRLTPIRRTPTRPTEPPIRITPIRPTPDYDYTDQVDTDYAYADQAYTDLAHIFTLTTATLNIRENLNENSGTEGPNIHTNFVAIFVSNRFAFVCFVYLIFSIWVSLAVWFYIGIFSVIKTDQTNTCKKQAAKQKCRKQFKTKTIAHQTIPKQNIM